MWQSNVTIFYVYWAGEHRLLGCYDLCVLRWLGGLILNYPRLKIMKFSDLFSLQTWIFVDKETSSFGFAFFVEWKFVGSNVEEISLLILETKILTISYWTTLDITFLWLSNIWKLKAGRQHLSWWIQNIDSNTISTLKILIKIPFPLPLLMILES